MRDARVWHALLGVEKKTVVEDVEFDELDQVLVVRVRPARAATRWCGVCRCRCGRYDSGEGRRRWRALDLGLPETQHSRRADRRDTTAPAGSRPRRSGPHPRCAEIPTRQESGRSPYATWMPYASRGWSKKRPYHKRALGRAERQPELKINVGV